MSIISEETIKEAEEKMGDFYFPAEFMKEIILLELVKQLQRQNELLNILQANVKEVSLNLETIEETLEYLSDINDKME